MAANHTGFYSDLSVIDNVDTALDRATDLLGLADGKIVEVKSSASSASSSAELASTQASQAVAASTQASSSANQAVSSANAAALSVNQAASSATNASSQASLASASAVAAASSATLATQKAAQWVSSTDVSQAPTTADVQAVIDNMAPTGIMMWPKKDYSVNEGALTTGTKGVLNLINGATFNGGYPSALPGLTFGMVDKGLRLRRLKGSSSTDFADWMVSREADYTGGTPGFVNAATLVETTVRNGTKAFEWNHVTRLNNYASEGENCSRYAQGRKYGVGGTWSDVIEMRDYTVNPTASAVALEVDVFANGSDNNGNRVGIDLVVGKNDSSGSQAVVGHAMRLNPQNGNVDNGRVVNGWSIYGNVDCIINAQGTGTRLIQDSGNRTVGIDLISANYTAAAVRVNGNQKITWEASAAISTYYDTTKGQFTFANGVNQLFAISTSGKSLLDANGKQVLGVRATGWNNPIGTSLSRAALDTTWSNTASASYVQAELAKANAEIQLLNQTLAALIKDLMGHGLIEKT